MWQVSTERCWNAVGEWELLLAHFYFCRTKLRRGFYDYSAELLSEGRRAKQHAATWWRRGLVVVCRVLRKYACTRRASCVGQNKVRSAVRILLPISVVKFFGDVRSSLRGSLFYRKMFPSLSPHAHVAHACGTMLGCRASALKKIKFQRWCQCVFPPKLRLLHQWQAC